MPPIDPELDEDLTFIRVAQELGVAVTDLADVPAHFVAAAMTLLTWQRIEHESAREKTDRQRKAAEMKRKQR